jgi:hypothetical protein
VAEEEFELPYEDYEVVPVTPLRKLEKRLEALEASRTVANLERFLDKIIDMTELNQRIVEEVVRSNQGLREEIEVLVGKLGNLEEKLETFVDLLKSIGEEELKGASPEEYLNPVLKKFEEIAANIAEGNKNIIQALTSIDKRLRRLGGEYTPPTEIFARRQQSSLTPPPPPAPRASLPPHGSELERR